ncbi:MAG: AmmeMemoRadiSam system protein B [bacterium]
MEKQGRFNEHKNFIRQPVVSGQFYPASPEELRRTITGFLDQVPTQEVSGDLVALVCPHAGYFYSGRVAAHSYALLKGKGIRTVVLAGPSHRFPLEGASVWPQGRYRTPLGDVPIDEQTAARLTNASPNVTFESRAHFHEHSLEVQVPFLQTVLEDFSIVPIIVGEVSATDLTPIARELASILKRPDTVLIVSTDLSHYHSYDTATALDKGAIEAIQSGEGTRLQRMVQEGKAELCGLSPMLLLLATMKHMGGKVDTRLLTYANSGDTAGMKDRVVGYAALAVTTSSRAGEQQSDSTERGENEVTEGEERLNDAEKKKLLRIARSTITAYLTGQDPPRIEVTEPRLLEARGVFVTLHKKGMLRGCIGFIKPVMPLHKATADCAISAAVKDYRFPTLRKEELDDIDIEISALTPLRTIKDINEIKVGEHGLYISHSHNSGLLLPQVATEYGWDRETFLAQTCRKAGLPENAWEKGADIYIFAAQVFGEKEQ